jgi:hypothetical protein
LVVLVPSKIGQQPVSTNRNILKTLQQLISDSVLAQVKRLPSHLYT